MFVSIILISDLTLLIHSAHKFLSTKNFKSLYAFSYVPSVLRLFLPPLRLRLSLFYFLNNMFLVCDASAKRFTGSIIIAFESFTLTVRENHTIAAVFADIVFHFIYHGYTFFQKRGLGQVYLPLN